MPFLPSLSSAALRESPNSIPVHSMMLSSHLFFCHRLLLAPFTLSPEELSLSCQRILRRGHIIWVSVSLPWLDHHELQLHSGFCCEPPRSSHGLCKKCSEVSYSISSQGLRSFSRFLLSRSSPHRHKGRWIRLASASVLIFEASEMFLSPIWSSVLNELLLSRVLSLR